MYDTCLLLDSLGKIQWISAISPVFEESGIVHEEIQDSYLWEWDSDKKSEIQAAIAAVQHFKEPQQVENLRHRGHIWNMDLLNTGLGLICVLATAFQAEIQILSDREVDVLALIGAHKSVSQIARKLQICPSTVETHRRSIRRKLRLKSDHALPEVAHRAGLVKDPLSPH